MLNQTDLIAKLLANEDITVVHANAETASFDIINRVLTLPTWKDSSADLIGMLVGHEVGHALYTTQEYMDHEFKDSYAFKTYLNVLEDVRIEKFMKRRYPGIRKTFLAGYKELNDRDFFEVKSRDLNDILLIDKINLYFKAGYDCGVSFSKKEKQFVDRAEKTETIPDVIQLAKDLFEYTKEELAKTEEKQKEQMEEEQMLDDLLKDMLKDEDGNADDNEEDMDGDGAEVTESMKNHMPDHSEEEQLTSKTETAYQKNIQALADTNTINKYWVTGKVQFDPLVQHTDLRKYIKKQVEINHAYTRAYDVTEEKLTKLENLKTNSARVVSYLTKEFEMKKAATAYKRATVAKSGQLDMRKIYSYQLKDDLFKRVTTVKNGKNHGMVFLLDWSGSMSSVIDQTIDQVVNLAMFCRRAQIPFSVLSFSTSYKSGNYPFGYESPIGADNELNPNGRFALLEFFNHKMSNTDFNSMIYNLKMFRDSISMGSTPLNESLIYLNDTFIPEFKQKHNVEKLTFITLTDGAGDGMGPYGGSSKYLRDEHGGKTLNNYITNPLTKKNYAISPYESASLTTALLSMIKDNHKTTNIGFFLCNSGWGSVHSAVRSLTQQDVDVRVVERISKEMKEKGFGSLKAGGRDDTFIVPLQSTRIQDKTLDDIKTTTSAASIAKQFGKVMNKSKTSRILLNKFIDYIA
jgi:hypothetical protein